MRTTVELPNNLMRAAKSRAAERGESLKDFFARAVAGELGSFATGGLNRRVELPLIASKGSSKSVVTNNDIEELFAAEDSEKYGNQ